MVKRTKEVALIGFLTALIAVTGMIKLPGLVPGTEFQFSAPVAVGICAAFGVKRYLVSGVLASLVSLALGLQTILNVSVSMSFRVAVGMALLLLGNTFVVVILAGPFGTFCGRLVLALLTQTNVWVLLAAAGVGMIYTAVSSYPVYRGLAYLAQVGGFREFLVVKRNPVKQLFQQRTKRKEEVSRDIV